MIAVWHCEEPTDLVGITSPSTIDQSMLYSRLISIPRTSSFLKPRCLILTRQLSHSPSLYKAAMTEKDPGYKDRPPYQIRSDEEFGPVQWRASCHCGQVTYKINRELPLNAKYCHCHGCQKTHGEPSRPLEGIQKANMHQAPRSNGALSSTNPISSSTEAQRACPSTHRRTSRGITSCRPRWHATTVGARSWTRAAMSVCSSLN